MKRALRESSFFALDLAGHIGTRTKHLQGKLRDHLMGKGIAEKAATEAATTVAGIFGKLETLKKKDGSEETKATTLAFISPEEWKLAEELAEQAAAGAALPKDKDLKKLVLPYIHHIPVYQAGKPIAETAREIGLVEDDII